MVDPLQLETLLHLQLKIQWKSSGQFLCILLHFGRFIAIPDYCLVSNMAIQDASHNIETNGKALTLGSTPNS